MEGGLETVNAAALKSDIGKTGHVAVYGIYFDTAKADVKPESAPTLQEIGKLLDQDPKLTWALANPGRFPVELMTASREELQRVPGFGPLAVERIVSTRARGALRDAADLRRLGVQVGRAGGFVTLRGRLIGTRTIQTPLFATVSKREVYGYNPEAFQ